MLPSQQPILTRKQMRIASMIAQGMSNREIAAELRTSEQGVKNYAGRIYDRLGVRGRVHLTLWMLQGSSYDGVGVA